MKRLSAFIAAGLVFAAFPGEIANQLLVRRTLHGFVVTVANYVWFLALGYHVRRSLDRRLGSRYRGAVAYYLFYGFLGLSIEWLLLVPQFAWQVNPVQLMMFSFWAGMMTTPCILTEEPGSDALRAIQAGLRRYILVWSVIAFTPFFVAVVAVPRIVTNSCHFALLAFGVGVLGTNLYFFRYFRLLKRETLQAEEAFRLKADPGAS